MFDSSAELTDELAYKVTRGTVEGIGELQECSITKEEMCNNMLMGLHFLTLYSHFQGYFKFEDRSYNKIKLPDMLRFLNLKACVISPQKAHPILDV